MRILQVNTYHYRRGGDCVHALSLADALREAGHEVRFFGMRHPQNLPSADEDHWVPYIDFAELNSEKTVGHAVEVLDRTLYSRKAARCLRGMLDEWQPDVAHFHSVMGHLSLSVLVELNRRGIPVVWTIHDYKLICPNTQLLCRGEICEACKGHRYLMCLKRRCKKDSAAASAVAVLEALVARAVGPEQRVAAFIAPSRFVLDKFSEFGWDTSRFLHIPNFAPSDRIPVQRAVDDELFVYVGRLDPAKGVATLINAVSAIPSARLEVAGSGPAEAELRSLADRTAPGRVTFRGSVDTDELARMRDAAIATVVPSEWYENSPYAVTESFRRGCPVVAARIGGLPELVTDGGSGLLFRAGDADDLASVLTTLAGDHEMQSSLTRGALAAADALGIEEYASRIAGVYGSAIQGRKG